MIMNYYIITETNWAKLRDEILSLAESCHKAFGEKSKHTDWLHNGDVCRLLNISKRTLQHYRDTGMMETARDLNMETDEMQLVVSALRGVGKRIVEVADTHKPLFAGEHFLTGKEVCERLYISPRTLQDYRDRKIIPYTQFAGKILYKTSDLEKMLEENYK